MQETVRSLEDTATELSREAFAFVEKHKDKPFFLYYPTTNIHIPLTPHKRFKGSTKAGVYGLFVVEFDWAVGQLLDALDRDGLKEKTLVVLTSDNGARPHPSLNGHRCNGPWRGTKRQIHEGGHRVPLIARWPIQVKAGITSNETVCLTDFSRTFAKLLGQEVPQNAGEDSYDITNILHGKPHRRPLREATVHHSAVAGQFALRQGDWKLIEGAGDGECPRDAKGSLAVVSRIPTRNPDSGEWLELDYFGMTHDGEFQLYNLKEDPAETKNVSKDYPDKVRELKTLLNRYRSSRRSN